MNISGDRRISGETTETPHTRRVPAERQSSQDQNNSLILHITIPLFPDSGGERINVLAARIWFKVLIDHHPRNTVALLKWIALKVRKRGGGRLKALSVRMPITAQVLRPVPTPLAPMPMPMPVPMSFSMKFRSCELRARCRCSHRAQCTAPLNRFAAQGQFVF